MSLQAAVFAGRLLGTVDSHSAYCVNLSQKSTEHVTLLMTHPLKLSVSVPVSLIDKAEEC